MVSPLVSGIVSEGEESQQLLATTSDSYGTLAGMTSNDGTPNNIPSAGRNDATTSQALAEEASSSGVSESEYPPPLQVAVIMVCILSAIFLMSLDRTIIATAIPKITDEFNSIGDVGWYGSAFMLTTSCFQLLWGKFYTFYSPKYVFLALVGLFEIGSAICGAATSSRMFIFGRAFAGMGSAGILSGAIVLMVSAVPLAKRPLYNGYFSIVLGLSSILGPLLGGVFTTSLSWRWCFWINLPIGGVAILVIWLALKPTPAAMPGLKIRQQLAKLDLLGEFFLFSWLLCLLLALHWGGSGYQWSDWRITLLFALFTVLFAAFAVTEAKTQKTATIQFRVITNRTMLAAMWYMFCLSATMLTMIYYIPLWFQAVQGVSAIQSGRNTLPLVLSLVVGSTFSGQMVGRFGYYTPFAMASSCSMPIGAGLISTFGTNSGPHIWITYQIILGFGIGLGMQQASIAVMTVLQPEDVPIGVSLIFFCQQLGGAIFISVGQNVFSARLVHGLTRVVKDLDPDKIIRSGATNLRKLVPKESLQDVLVVYNDALGWMFIVATVMAALSAIGSFAFEWRSVKDEQRPMSKVGDDESLSSGSISARD
ncbi:MFS general substrate transporter [Aureobasidium pullulans]|nr:MFS general substrate transporter [Aureobasidium pullulans]